MKPRIRTRCPHCHKFHYAIQNVKIYKAPIKDLAAIAMMNNLFGRPKFKPLPKDVEL